MKTNTVIICDEDETYVRFLDGYVRGATYLPLKIREVTTSKHLKEALSEAEKEKGSRNLIISAALYEEASLPDQSGCNVLLLTGDGKGALPREHAHLRIQDRYRPAKEIASALFAMMSEDENTICSAGAKRAPSETLIGFYSPVKRSFQTTFALTLGQLLAERERVLYLSFEAYGGIYFDGAEMNGNLTDLLYYYDCAKEKLPLHAERFREEVNGLSCIRPANTAAELREVEYATWQGMIETLTSSGAYDKILLDLTDLVDGVTKLLSGCARVFMTTVHGAQEEQKVRQYLSALKRDGEEELLRRMKCVTLPKTGTVALPMLKNSEIATYIRKAGLTAL